MRHVVRCKRDEESHRDSKDSQDALVYFTTPQGCKS